MRSIARSAFLAALLVLGGAAAASATTNFGTTETGQYVLKTIYFQWSDLEPGYIVGFTMPNGYYVNTYTQGDLQFGQSFYVQVYLLSNTPGTYEGNMLVHLSNFNGKFEFLTGVVVAPCTSSPTVSITGPANGSTKSPNAAGNVILTANASDPAGIDRVDFYVDGAQVASDTVPSYAYAWPAKNGSHQVYARAYNSCGNSTVSSTVTFTVSCGNPAVTLTSPVHGSTVTPNASGNVILQATASHSTGISKVDFLVDGVVVATDTVAPYAYAWPATSGSHNAKARAFTNCGGPGVPSNTATFTVN